MSSSDADEVSRLRAENAELRRLLAICIPALRSVEKVAVELASQIEAVLGD